MPDTTALKHLQLIIGRLAQSLRAFAHHHAAGGASELAAAIVGERRTASKQAIQKNLALLQGDGESFHACMTLQRDQCS